MAPDHEQWLITKFVEHLFGLGLGSGQVDRWPDREPHTGEEIDAISGEIAIEHTSIDTLPNQRRNDVWYEDFLDSLKDTNPCPNHFVTIALPYDIVSRHGDIKQRQDTLHEWLHNTLPELPDTLNKCHKVTLAGMPFPFYYTKNKYASPGIHFSRLEPDDNTLAHRLGALINKKSAKLKKYSTSHKTILLLESSDIALMNQAKARYSAAIGLESILPEGIHYLWYAETGLSDYIIFTDISNLSDVDIK